MRALWIGIVCVALVACQTNTQPSVPRPDLAPIEGEIGPLAPFVSQAVVSERRAQINDCLVAHGLPPLPDGLYVFSGTVRQGAPYAVCLCPVGCASAHRHGSHITR